MAAARYNVGVPCKNGHTSGRYVSTKRCVQCSVDAAAAWNKANPEKHNKHCTDYVKNNPEKVNKRYNSWVKRNYERKIANNKAWNERHWDRYLAISRNWKRRNQPQVKAIAARRRAAEIERMPNWLSDDDQWIISEVYDLALQRSALTGVSWHVDHVVPLQGKNVSGLHVPWNLQVILASENLRKGNRFNG
jgi:hypothetical protein